MVSQYVPNGYISLSSAAGLSPAARAEGFSVASDFYTTMAQVLPLLLLALIWDSSFLDRLRGQRRPLRRVDPSGVLFWTKPRVRAYTLSVATVVIVLTGVCVLELAGFIPNSFALRVVMSCGLALVLGTLLTRVWYDVLGATSAPSERAAARLAGGGGSAASGDDCAASRDGSAGRPLVGESELAALVGDGGAEVEASPEQS
jgi:hypothetical protein